MRFIAAIALSLAAVVAAAPGASQLAARQLCTVDCRCLTSTGVPTFPNTERCCVPPGVLDTPGQYCRSIPQTIDAILAFGNCCGNGQFDCTMGLCPI